jgi:hypothetical protein
MFRFGHNEIKNIAKMKKKKYRANEMQSRANAKRRVQDAFS